MEKIYAKRIKELRNEHNLSQPQLAEKLGVSNGLISLWENGLREPSMSSLVQMAKVFDVSIDYIVGIENFE